ncbi:NF038120 family PEP-CTERM protein [Rugamonas apoptosis]|uniref:NF038120 family PEP-CTERM protein n=1 Tax=Rugamonas apoptosis TaxID=2758570 RepID=A0A7W2INB0_9BURK|nr:NF038120 family PEP-CTERM protein [Rugamonas apoptosis]MBA5690421.1 NF038120 family PEP-CTERM protein [Rugamonas apoptosis]
MKSTPTLKQLAGVVVSAVTLLGAAPAMADTISFEAHGPDIFAGGDTFAEAGYTMQVLDTVAGNGGGFAGAIANGADPTTCTVAACPVGNNSMYYLGLNDGGLNIHRTDASAFSLHGLDYAFLAPIGGLHNFSYGQLMLTGTAVGGGTVRATFDFPLQNGAGNYVFGGAPLNAAFGQTKLSGLNISACMFDNSGNCYNPADNQAQFAIDNLNVSAVPEPSAYAMLMLGLGGVAFAARRRARQAGQSAPTLPAQA